MKKRRKKTEKVQEEDRHTETDKERERQRDKDWQREDVETVMWKWAERQR